MNELFTAIEAYIIKTATAAAEARFNEMMAGKILGVNDGKLDKLAESAVDAYLENSELIVDKIEMIIENYDADDKIRDKVTEYVNNMSFSVRVD